MKTPRRIMIASSSAFAFGGLAALAVVSHVESGNTDQPLMHVAENSPAATEPAEDTAKNSSPDPTVLQLNATLVAMPSCESTRSISALIGLTDPTQPEEPAPGGTVTFHWEVKSANEISTSHSQSITIPTGKSNAPTTPYTVNTGSDVEIRVHVLSPKPYTSNWHSLTPQC